ncbi:MAG: hypothetical protein NZM27_01040 [Acetobacteraceae bacterium]|nr:hypothetical protein [Acetobacteraceae bacterium]MCX7683876.1 hypothetical protein [Acetobacteraceae bacterium]MDW8400014.1 hypothetical protein [Acetobacteraceae bacterium]
MSAPGAGADPGGPGAPPPRDELQALREAIDAGQVRLGVHIRRMNSPGSPVYNAAENILPAALVLGGSFAGSALVHWYLGAAVLALGCWWWIGHVQPKVRDAVYERTALYALSDVRRFDALWGSGVLSLYAKLPDGEERVATRQDSWRHFVRCLPGSGFPEATGAAES